MAAAAAQEVLSGLASRLGHAERFSYRGPEQVFDELARASAGGRADDSGISYDRLDAGEAIHWPCPAPDHPGRRGSSLGPLPTATAAPAWSRSPTGPQGRSPTSPTRSASPTGRYREHYNSGSQTRRLEALRRRRPRPVLQIHPSLARRAGLADGQLAEVQSRRGSVRFRAHLSEDIRADTVFAPFHWPGSEAANLLTSPILDPVSHMPEFKVCAVRPAPAP